MGFSDFFRKKGTGSIAKDRLKLVLVSDRAGCSPEIMEQIKKDIITVISKYIEIDADDVEIALNRTETSETGNGPALVANIPIKNMRGR